MIEKSGEGSASDAARALLAQAQAGDRAAFDQIVLLYQRKAISLAWRLLGNREDAHDAAQETFLRVYKHFDTFDPKLDFTAWLSRIVVNVCRDLARKRKINFVSLETEFESGGIDEPASPNNTEDGAAYAETQAMILAALATLSEKERAALVLRDLEGFSTEEVARILGSSPTTVRSQISMARTRIKAFRDTRNRRPQRHGGTE